MKMKYSLINEYEKCLRESVKKKQIEESTMQVYLAGVDRILRAVISVLPKKNIGAIIKPRKCGKTQFFDIIKC